MRDEPHQGVEQCADSAAVNARQDRYYGVNDPVARKMLSRVDAMPKMDPPEDSTITTLCAAALDSWADSDSAAGSNSTPA